MRYMAHCGSVVQSPSEKLDATQHRDAFGTVWRTDSLTPLVVEPGLKAPSFQGYTFPSAAMFRNATAKAKAKKRVQEAPDSFTLVSPDICLWQSWYLRGFETTLMDCAAEEDFYAELLDRMTELCLALVAECADIPADAIMLGDDWGDQRGVLIGPQRWRKFFKPRYARIFKAIHAQGKVAVMHCCGSMADIMADIIEIGLDVLESVQPEAARMNPYGLKKAWAIRSPFGVASGASPRFPSGRPVSSGKK